AKPRIGRPAVRKRSDVQRKDGSELGIPSDPVDVEQHGARGVARFSDVAGAAGQFPYEPGVHGAEQQIALAQTVSNIATAMREPFELRCRECGIEVKPGTLLDQRRCSRCMKRRDFRSASPALPDHCRKYRLSGPPVP